MRLVIEQSGSIIRPDKSARLQVAARTSRDIAKAKAVPQMWKTTEIAVSSGKYFHGYLRR